MFICFYLNILCLFKLEIKKERERRRRENEREKERGEEEERKKRKKKREEVSENIILSYFLYFTFFKTLKVLFSK